MQLNQKLLFLAGPLTGISYEEAISWRTYVKQKLPNNITAFSALRGKNYLSDKAILRNYYADKPLSTPKGTITRDRNDITHCDALFVNLLGANQISIGSMFEIAWADLKRIPIIVVMEQENVHEHVFVREAAGYVTQDIDEAINITISVINQNNNISHKPNSSLR
jgi:hypothetical protein